MSQMPKIIADPKTLEEFQYVTIVGKLVPKTVEDFMKLCLLGYRFRQAVKHGINLVLRGVPQREAYKELARMLPSSIYGETAYKYARLLVEGAKGRKIELRRIWIASRGGVTWRGNLNIKLVSTNRILVRYYNNDWIELETRFGKKYLPLIEELVELANARRESYGAVIVFRDGKVYLHLEVPLWLHLKHFSKPKWLGYGLVAGFDLNSDRINVVVLDREGRIVAMKTFWYPEVTSPGFPRSKARFIRLEKLSEALKWCRRIGVDYVAFENLTKVKMRRFTNNSNANRKISRFAKKELLKHGVIKALKLGLTIILVDPKGTSNSVTHRQIMKEKGMDRHIASAYIIAKRAWKQVHQDQTPATTPPT